MSAPGFSCSKSCGDGAQLQVFAEANWIFTNKYMDYTLSMKVHS